MRIVEIDWLDEEIQESAVILESPNFRVRAFAHPYDAQVGAEAEPLEPLFVKDLKIGVMPTYRFSSWRPFEAWTVGFVIGKFYDGYEDCALVGIGNPMPAGSVLDPRRSLPGDFEAYLIIGISNLKPQSLLNKMIHQFISFEASRLTLDDMTDGELQVIRECIQTSVATLRQKNLLPTNVPVLP